MKILLIESDKLLADNLSSSLKKAGHKVYWNNNLQSAIEAMDKDTPQAVIIDLVLADRSGAEFLYELRSYPEWQKLPVIIWSDLTEAETQPLVDGLKELNISYFYHKSNSRIKDLLNRLNHQPATA